MAPELESARERVKELKKQVDRLGIATALVMGEQPGVERPSDFVRIRGGFANKSEKVYGGVPAVLGSLPSDAPANRSRSRSSGWSARTIRSRHELLSIAFGSSISDAAWSKRARISVRRAKSRPIRNCWTGSRWSSWIANWSMKAMHRLIVSSSAYRQSSAITPEVLRADPYNRLISRGPRFRLAAESVRDVALAASGLLSRKIGGPSVFPPQPAGVWDLPYNDEKWEESKGEDKYRRGIYTVRAAVGSASGDDELRRHQPGVLHGSTNSHEHAAAGPDYVERRRLLRDGAGARKTNGARRRRRRSFARRLRFPPRDGTFAEAGESDSILTWLEQEKQKPVSKRRPAQTGARTSRIREAPAYVMLANILLNLDEALTKE